MKEILWAILAYIVSRPAIAAWIIRRAKRTAYVHITSRDGKRAYMNRWWFFNPNKDGDNNPITPRWPSLPSIRVHEILRPDDDKHLHSHPWQARTIVLKGWYAEERESDPHVECYREAGYTGTIRPELFHRITDVSKQGQMEPNGRGKWAPAETCTTLFFTWGKAGEWGFKVGERTVPWREYLAQQERCCFQPGNLVDDPAPGAPHGTRCTVCGTTYPF